MNLELFLRLAIGVLLGACLWAIGNRAHADFPGTVTEGTCYRGDGAQIYFTYDHKSRDDCWAWVTTNLHPCSSGSWYHDSGSYPTEHQKRDFTYGSSCSPWWVYWWQGGLSYVSCPANSTKNGTTGMCSCNAGYHEDGAGGCVSNDCPANSSWNGSTCACNSGYDSYNGSCVLACAASGTKDSNYGTYYSGSGALPSYLCVGGNSCAYGITTGVGLVSVGGWGAWAGLSAGRHCQAGDVAGTAAASSCPVGQCPGTVNGTSVCLACSSTPSNVVVENTSGSTTTTNKDATGAVTGSTSTTTTTSSTTTGGQTTVGTTTTTTTKDGAGNVTGTASTTGSEVKPVDSFCKENPGASICKASSWGGGCGSFSCDGDAVQCAIAKEIYQRNCTLFETQTALSTLGNQVTSGQDPQASLNPALEANRQSVSMSGAISEDSFLAQGGLADQQIVVSPRLTVTLPWSQLNYYLSIMGAIVVAFALVAAARIVVGGT